MLRLSRRATGGLGNRLFHLNLLAQLSASSGIPYVYAGTPESRLLFEVGRKKIIELKSKPDFTGELLLGLDKQQIFDQIIDQSKIKKNLYFEPPLLGELFHKFTDVPPRDLLTIRRNSKKERPYVAVHIRGRDFFQWDKKSILPVSYYRDSIEFVKSYFGADINIQLFTDDLNLPSVRELTSQNIATLCSSGSKRDEIKDFVAMANSVGIISSASTFSIWAGLLGPEKLIIHSRDWVDSKSNMGDLFWSNLKNSLSDFYRAELI